MYTSCPECGTVYRVTTVQLRVAEGQVRCGNCAATFNALASLSDEAPDAANTAAEPARPEPPVTRQPEAGDATPAWTAVAAQPATPETETKTGTSSDDTLEFDVPEDHWSKFFGTPVAAPAHPAPAVESGEKPDDEPEDEPDDGTFVPVHFEAEDWQTLLDEVGEDDDDANAEPVYVIGQDSSFAALQPIDPATAPGTTIDDDPHRFPSVPADEIPETMLGTVPHDIGEETSADAGGAGPDFDPGTLTDHDASSSADGAPAADALHFDVFADPLVEQDHEARLAFVRAPEPAYEPEPDAEPEADFDPAPRPHRKSASLADSPAERPFAWQPETAHAPESRRGPYYAVGSVLLILVLAGQFIHRQRDELATHPFWGSPLSRAYESLGAPLHPAWNLNAYEVRASEAVVGRTAPGALDISARIGIVGTEAVGLPLLRVTLRDRRANVIGSGIFEPEDYLLRDEAPPDGLLTPGLVFPVQISVADPGTDANGYEVDICIRARDQAVRCQRDADPFRS